MSNQTFVKNNIYQLVVDVILILLLVVALICIPGIGSIPGIVGLLGRKTYLLFALVGMVFVQAGGSVDISSMTQVAMISAILFRLADSGAGIEKVILLCILVGAAFGALKGFSISVMGLAATAACVCAAIIYYGVFLQFGGNGNSTHGMELLQSALQTDIFGIPVILIAGILIVIVTDVFFNCTYWGKEILCMKLAPGVVKRAGINTGMIVIATSTICGALMAISSVVYASSNGPIGVENGMEIFAQTVTLAHLSSASMSPQVYGIQKFRSWRILVVVLIMAGADMCCEIYGVPSGVIYVIYGVLMADSIMKGKEAVVRRRGSKVFLRP